MDKNNFVCECGSIKFLENIERQMIMCENCNKIHNSKTFKNIDFVGGEK